MIAPSDAHLVQRTLQGELAAFDDLVRRYQQRLYRLALRYLQNKEDAQDALQDSLWLAFSRLRTLQHRTTFFQWLCQITHRTAITQRRRKKPWISLDALLCDDGFEQQDSLPAPEDAMHQDEFLHDLHAALARLSPAHRDVVQLDLDGETYPEIAKRLQIPLGTVRSRLHRARAHLREELAAYVVD
jgi:RNA polymerase sigma-70 factor (ECF subfamily)